MLITGLDYYGRMREFLILTTGDWKKMDLLSKSLVAKHATDRDTKKKRKKEQKKKKSNREEITIPSSNRTEYKKKRRDKLAITIPQRTPRSRKLPNILLKEFLFLKK